MKKLKKLVICGGAINIGNIGNKKNGIEFNFHMDTEAALIVLQASSYEKVDLIPYDTVYNANIPLVGFPYSFFQIQFDKFYLLVEVEKT